MYVFFLILIINTTFKSMNILRKFMIIAILEFMVFSGTRNGKKGFLVSEKVEN